MIAWRYLRASRREGGVSVLTWISLIGISLAVFALIAVMAVRSGFRTEFVDTILGANAHVTVYAQAYADDQGRISRVLTDFDTRAQAIAALPGITRVAPLVRGQVLASLRDQASGADVYGIREADLLTLPRIANPESAQGDIARFGEGIAMGAVLARNLGVVAGDRVKLLSPNGSKTALGTSPRVKSYEVTYIFEAGRFDIDRSRIYMPFDEAQSFFNREGVADELEVMVIDPEAVDDHAPAILTAAGSNTLLWSWRDFSGAFLRALTVEDNVMWVVMGVLVLIATMNIISGLVMLVKNKGRDIGILRTMGLTEGAILRIFFMCGAALGVSGTIIGVVLGCAFAIWIDPIFAVVNYLAGGGVWDPEVRGTYHMPAELRLWDVQRAVMLSLGLSFIVTIFPARRAARMNPVEALRHE